MYVIKWETTGENSTGNNQYSGAFRAPKDGFLGVEWKGVFFVTGESSKGTVTIRAWETDAHGNGVELTIPVKSSVTGDLGGMPERTNAPVYGQFFTLEAKKGRFYTFGLELTEKDAPPLAGHVDVNYSEMSSTTHPIKAIEITNFINQNTVSPPFTAPTDGWIEIMGQAVFSGGSGDGLLRANIGLGPPGGAALNTRQCGRRYVTIWLTDLHTCNFGYFLHPVKAGQVTEVRIDFQYHNSRVTRAVLVANFFQTLQEADPFGFGVLKIPQVDVRGAAGL